MGYDANGLGFNEMTQTELYFPTTYKVLFDEYSLGIISGEEFLRSIKKVVDTYNEGMIEMEVK